ncbi:hypothetical protein [Synechococcus sp. BIOS-E4-1]|nr:hypothetical protein [Synechococcus sp. BIOS-E4-1]
MFFSTEGLAMASCSVTCTPGTIRLGFARESELIAAAERVLARV